MLWTESSGGPGDDIIIAAGSQQTITVIFNPDQPGVYEGLVTITSNDPQQQTVNLELTGQVQSPQPDILLTGPHDEPIDDTLDFGSVLRDSVGSDTTRRWSSRPYRSRQ